MLAACATTPPSSQPIDATQQRELLQGLVAFSFTARVAITGQDPIPSMQWQQQRDATTVKLNGPLGVGGLQFQYSPGRLRLVTSRGEKLEGEKAEQALVNAMGVVPPFDSLRYWILGVSAPGATDPIATYDADGLLQQLQQQGWTISYRRRMPVNAAVGVLRLPALLVATRDNLELRLVINQWRMK